MDIRAENIKKSLRRELKTDVPADLFAEFELAIKPYGGLKWMVDNTHYTEITLKDVIATRKATPSVQAALTAALKKLNEKAA